MFVPNITLSGPNIIFVCFVRLHILLEMTFFWLFPKLKKTTTGILFESCEDITQNVAFHLYYISNKVFQQ